MTPTLLRLTLVGVAGLALLATGATAAGAATATGAASCASAKWQVTETTDNVETLRECGETMAAEEGSTQAATDRDELPLTGAPALLAPGLALALIGLGAGFHLILRRHRRIFAA